MNRRELVAAVAAHTGQEPKAVDATIKGLTEVVTAVVAKGEPVAMAGFAKFAKVERSARMGRNPATGAQIKIKASKKARITPLKGFKDAVMAPSSAPKLARGVWPPAVAANGPRRPAAPQAAAKSTPAKKAPAKSASPAKKTPTTPAKKAPAKKAPAKKASPARKR